MAGVVRHLAQDDRHPDHAPHLIQGPWARRLDVHLGAPIRAAISDSTRSSITFIATPSRPGSVCGSVSGTRRFPAALC